MTTTPALRRTPLLGLALLVACGGEPPAETEGAPEAPAAAAETAQATATVTILEPTDGAEIAGPSVTVHLEASGVRIVAAGDTTPGTGHHHLYLDEDLGPAGTLVPTVPGKVVHLGTGDSEYVFESVAPGTHRLIAVLADGAHVPLQPWVTDTVTFTVR
ncbi:MAG TPA: DUF4399 domain-containing protein [Longimicrobiales bacterium]|nr:DUF4399 domain-containing protein [Longimicrobiales bacterium]